MMEEEYEFPKNEFPKKDKFAKVEKFTVIKAFTADKHYRANSVFESSNKELIRILLKDKYIK